LKHHVENSGHQLINQIDINTKQPLVYINSHSCRGYLLKMGQKFKTWNKRWFVFDRQKRTLCYYMDKHETKLRGSIYFQSINEVYVDHMRSIKSPDSKSTFVVKTFDRNFYFVAPSSELMRIWVDVIFTGAEGYLEFLNWIFFHYFLFPNTFTSEMRFFFKLYLLYIHIYYIVLFIFISGIIYSKFFF
jgi:hypothetical protein